MHHFGLMRLAMMRHGAGGHHLGGLLFLLAIGGMMIYRILRATRQARSRRLRLDQIWIMPAILLAATAFVFLRAPPHGIGWLAITPAAIAGAATGWWRGSLIRIGVDRRTQTLNQQATPAAAFFILGLFALRFGVRALFSGSAGHIAADVTDALMVFVLAMFTAERLEMFLRARRLLAV
jgi:hypothetical protein